LYIRAGLKRPATFENGHKVFHIDWFFAGRLRPAVFWKLDFRFHISFLGRLRPAVFELLFFDHIDFSGCKGSPFRGVAELVDAIGACNWI
jgi:hypothetical protein